MTTPRETAARYSTSQIALHWLIVALVAVQFLTAEAMEQFFDKAEDAGTLAGFPVDSVAIGHAVVGAAVFLLTLVRLGLRWSFGAQPAPENMAPLVRLAAGVTHAGLYVLLIALPVTGVAALYLNPEAGDLHGVLKTVLLVLIAAHVAGAAVHAFVYRDGVLGRMLP
jgi:cytochrome b561